MSARKRAERSRNCTNWAGLCLNFPRSQLWTQRANAMGCSIPLKDGNVAILLCADSEAVQKKRHFFEPVQLPMRARR